MLGGRSGQSAGANPILRATPMVTNRRAGSAARPKDGHGRSPVDTRQRNRAEERRREGVFGRTNELHLVESYACDCDSFKIKFPVFSKIDFSVVGPPFLSRRKTRKIARPSKFQRPQRMRTRRRHRKIARSGQKMPQGRKKICDQPVFLSPEAMPLMLSSTPSRAPRGAAGRCGAA